MHMCMYVRMCVCSEMFYEKVATGCFATVANKRERHSQKADVGGGPAVQFKLLGVDGMLMYDNPAV